MITAKEANELTTNSKANLDYTMKIIEKMIIEQTNKGYYSLELTKPINNINFEVSVRGTLYNDNSIQYTKEQKPILDVLRENGYNISTVTYSETVSKGVLKKEKEVLKYYVAIYWYT